MVKIDGYGDNLTVNDIRIGDLSPSDHEKIEKEKTAKIEQYDLVNKISKAPIKIWQEIEEWVGKQNVVKLESSDSILLRDAKGMNDIFSPTIGQSQRLLAIYKLVKDFGFEGEI